MNAALAVFEAAIAGHIQTTPGRDSLVMVFEDGYSHPLPYDDWVGQPVVGDEALLDRCHGPTLDIGCGPGRFVEALLRCGTPALGIDISSEALRQTRERGGLALQRDVFSRVPGDGRWRHVLLADGNIGIGGDPDGLLRRCRSLIAEDGTVLVEVAPESSSSRVGRARLEAASHRSPWFPWAIVSADDVAVLARGAGLRVVEVWSTADRWFVELSPRRSDS